MDEINNFAALKAVVEDMTNLKDELGIQGYTLPPMSNGDTILAKPLKNGDIAFCLLNEGDFPKKMILSWQYCGWEMTDRVRRGQPYGYGRVCARDVRVRRAAFGARVPRDAPVKRGRSRIRILC